MIKRDRRRGGAQRAVGCARMRRPTQLLVTSRTWSHSKRLALHAAAVIAEVMYQPPGPTDTELSLVPERQRRLRVLWKC